MEASNTSSLSGTQAVGGIFIYRIACLESFATTFVTSAMLMRTSTASARDRIGECAQRGLPWKLGFEDDLLRHGIQREVFISQLADNALKVLHSGRGRPNLSSLLSADEVASLAVDRWMLPRSERRPEFKVWKRESIEELLGDQHGEVPPKVRVQA